MYTNKGIALRVRSLLSYAWDRPVGQTGYLLPLLCLTYFFWT